MPVLPERRHMLQLSDDDLSAIERALTTRHRVLGLTGEMRPTDQINLEADLLARVCGLIQAHRGPRGCGCLYSAA
jgi:hypothetical protein